MDDAARRSDALKPLSGSPELRLIYQTAPIGLAFLSTDCRYLMINQHLTEICGIPVADHIGRSVRETVPQVAEQVEQVVQTILRTGEPVIGVEVNGQRPDGANTHRVWITYWHPLKDRSGTVVGINVAAEEITERKRAEAELSASRERLIRLNETLAERVEQQAQERDRIWKLSQDLLVVFDSRGNILNVNPAWSARLGWSAEELIGKNGEWAIHPEDRERTRAELASLATGGRTQNLETRVLCKDASYRWLSWFAVWDCGRIYASGRDITHLKQAQEELGMLRRQIAAASRQATMGAMTASIAHEIKQPLGAIGMNANAGLRWLTGPDANLSETQEALDQIVQNVHRIDQVIEGIRAMFKRGPGEQSFVDLRVLVGEVLALAQGEIESHRIAVRNDMPDELPAVTAERVQLQQVLLNLIMNASEAMSALNGRERRLTIAAQVDPQDRSVTITVEDTGCGIDPEQLPRVFDAFFTTKPEGTGLGLFVSRSIIEAHGGRLLASCGSPFGTVFHLTLPVAPTGSL
jgi:PAS domain S-box-containing protein